MIGFAIGLVGIALVIFATSELSTVGNLWVWASIALLAPLAYALRTILISVKLPNDVDMVAATGYCAVLAVIQLLPFVIGFDDFVALSLDSNSGNISLVLAIILLGIVTAVGVSLKVSLVRSAGAVFASQSSFIVTFAGIVWSIILLGESLPLIAWVALFLLVVGLILVGPKQEAEEVDPILLRKLDVDLSR